MVLVTLLVVEPVHAQCTQEPTCPHLLAAPELTRAHAGHRGPWAREATRLLVEATRALEADVPSEIEHAARIFRRLVDEYADLDRLDLSALPSDVPALTRFGARAKLAEALWHLQRYEECAAITAAWSRHRPASDELAYLDVLCHVAAHRESRDVDPSPALARYACAYPRPSSATAVRLQLARVSLEQRRFGVAAGYAEQVLRTAPDHGLAEEAASTWLRALRAGGGRCASDLERARAFVATVLPRDG